VSSLELIAAAAGIVGAAVVIWYFLGPWD